MSIYLYVKKCSHCNLKYFGRTAVLNPYEYKGSGTYWLRHLRHHGAAPITLKVWNFEDQERCTNFALSFSDNNNIVESKQWANLVPEHGTHKWGYKTKPYKRKSPSRPAGWHHSDETRRKLSASCRGKPKGPQSEEHKAKLAEIRKRKRIKKAIKPKKFFLVEYMHGDEIFVPNMRNFSKLTSIPLNTLNKIIRTQIPCEKWKIFNITKISISASL